MKIFTLITYPLILLVLISPGHETNLTSKKASTALTDSLVNICNIISTADIQQHSPFTNILTNIFPDPNNYETYSGCHYQFYTPDVFEKGQIAIRLLKYSSNKEAGEAFNSFYVSALNASDKIPERINGIADSAYFNYGYEDTTKCEDCGLVATIGQYGIYIAYKGQSEKIPRARKKESALRILQTMYDRIPGLAPSRIRNKQ